MHAVQAALGARYTLDGVLGAGMDSVVWSARDSVSRERVALKEVGTSGGSAQYFRELSILFRLQHPNIVRLLNILDTRGSDASGKLIGSCILILELCNRGSLRHFYESSANRSLSGPHVAHLLTGVAQGIGFAHHSGWVHRDLKPDNILLHVPQGASNRDAALPEVRVADFGLASSTARLKRRAGAVNQRLCSGTPRYMAPERWHGAGGPESDWYALGAIAYEMLTGESLFEGSVDQLGKQHLYSEPRFDGRIPPLWKAFLAGLLEKSPERRLSDVRLILSMLQELSAAEEAHPKKPSKQVSRLRDNRVSSRFAPEELCVNGAILVSRERQLLGRLGVRKTQLSWTEISLEGKPAFEGFACGKNGAVYGFTGSEVWSIPSSSKCTRVTKTASRIERLWGLQGEAGGFVALTEEGLECGQPLSGNSDQCNVVWRCPQPYSGWYPQALALPDGGLLLALGGAQPRLSWISASGAQEQTLSVPGLPLSVASAWPDELGNPQIVVTYLEGSSVSVGIANRCSGRFNKVHCLLSSALHTALPLSEHRLLLVDTSGVCSVWKSGSFWPSVGNVHDTSSGTRTPDAWGLFRAQEQCVLWEQLYHEPFGTRFSLLESKAWNVPS